MICLNPFVFLRKFYIWMSVVFQVHIKLTPLLLSKGMVQCIPAADIFEESMDTQDVTEEADKWSVTEIAVSISFGSLKFKMVTL